MNNEYLPPVLKEFKYYKGEVENDSPFPADDVRARYWWGERMFASIDDNERLFTDYMKDVKKWKEKLKKDELQSIQVSTGEFEIIENQLDQYETSDSNLISIMNVEANKSREDYLLDFDYLQVFLIGWYLS